MFPGKKMAGRMGGRNVTTQNLMVERIDLAATPRAQRRLRPRRGPGPAGLVRARDGRAEEGGVEGADAREARTRPREGRGARGRQRAADAGGDGRDGRFVAEGHSTRRQLQVGRPCRTNPRCSLNLGANLLDDAEGNVGFFSPNPAFPTQTFREEVHMGSCKETVLICSVPARGRERESVDAVTASVGRRCPRPRQFDKSASVRPSRRRTRADSARDAQPRPKLEKQLESVTLLSRRRDYRSWHRPSDDSSLPPTPPRRFPRRTHPRGQLTRPV